MRRAGALALLAGLLVASAAHAGGPELDSFALAIVDAPETVDGGALDGPPAARATWFFLGGIRPFSGEAMAAFSTGNVGSEPIPGTDLAAVGADDDIVGIRLALRAPSDGRSLRFAWRLLAPPELADDPDDLLDRLRVEAADDPLALDPWLGEPMGPDSVALQMGDAALLDGTGLAGSLLTPWMEAVVPVEPFAQVVLSFEVTDGGASAFGDLTALLDGVRFSPAIPQSVPPGFVPDVQSVTPARLPEDAVTRVLVSGRELPRTATWALVDPDGAEVAQIPASGVDWRGPERVWLDVPALEAATDLGLRVAWADDARLTWPAVLRVDTPAPSIDTVRPDVSPPAGGGLALVSGSGFHDVTSVRVGDAEVATWTAAGSDRLEIVLPPGDPGPARLLVIAAGGSVEHPAALTYASPAATDDEPTPGPGGPVVDGCDHGGSPGGPGLVVALLGLGLRRRSCAG